MKVEMPISNAISGDVPYFNHRAVPVHVCDVCHVDPSEAVKLVVAAFVLASASFASCFAITMSR